MTNRFKLSVVLSVIIATLAGLCVQSDAGLIFKNRVRGQFLQRLRDMRQSRAGSACADGSCAVAANANGQKVELGAPEALALQKTAAARAAVRRARFDRALYIFMQIHDDKPGLATAVNKLRASPEKMAKFQNEVQARYGVTLDSVEDIIKLFIQYSPEIIILILKIVAMI